MIKILCPVCREEIEVSPDADGQVSCPLGCGRFPLKWAQSYQKFLETFKKNLEDL